MKTFNATIESLPDEMMLRLEDLERAINTSTTTEKIAAAATVAAVVVAVFVAVFLPYIKRKFFVPRIGFRVVDPVTQEYPKKVTDKIETKDGQIKSLGVIREVVVSLDIYRLAITNNGKNVARKVRALAETLERHNPESQLWENVNITPIPLNWMHYETVSRDISVDETAYLDVIQRQSVDGSSYPKLFYCWPSKYGGQADDNLRGLAVGTYKLHISFYEEFRKLEGVVLRIENMKDGTEKVRVESDSGD